MVILSHYTDRVLLLLTQEECGSPEFDEFLSMLGDKIELKGWPRFSGGLDVASTLCFLPRIPSSFLT